MAWSLLSFLCCWATFSGLTGSWVPILLPLLHVNSPLARASSSEWRTCWDMGLLLSYLKVSRTYHYKLLWLSGVECSGFKFWLCHLQPQLLNGSLTALHLRSLICEMGPERKASALASFWETLLAYLLGALLVTLSSPTASHALVCVPIMASGSSKDSTVPSQAHCSWSLGLAWIIQSKTEPCLRQVLCNVLHLFWSSQ